MIKQIFNDYRRSLKAEKIDVTMFARNIEKSSGCSNKTACNMAVTIHPEHRVHVIRSLTCGHGVEKVSEIYSGSLSGVLWAVKYAINELMRKILKVKI